MLLINITCSKVHHTENTKKHDIITNQTLEMFMVCFIFIMVPTDTDEGAKETRWSFPKDMPPTYVSSAG